MAMIKLYLATYAKVLLLMLFGFLVGWAVSALPKRTRTRVEEDDKEEGNNYE